MVKYAYKPSYWTQNIDKLQITYLQVSWRPEVYLKCSRIYNGAFLWNQLTANNRKLFWQKFRLRWKFSYSKNFDNFHWVKSVRIRSYPIRMRENTDQNNSERGHFLCSFYVKQWIIQTHFMPVVSLYNIGKHLMFSGVIERVHWHVKHFKWRCKMKILKEVLVAYKANLICIILHLTLILFVLAVSFSLQDLKTDSNCSKTILHTLFGTLTS